MIPMKGLDLTDIVSKIILGWLSIWASIALFAMPLAFVYWMIQDYRYEKALHSSMVEATRLSDVLEVWRYEDRASGRDPEVSVQDR